MKYRLAQVINLEEPEAEGDEYREQEESGPGMARSANARDEDIQHCVEPSVHDAEVDVVLSAMVTAVRCGVQQYPDTLQHSYAVRRSWPREVSPAVTHLHEMKHDRQTEKNSIVSGRPTQHDEPENNRQGQVHGVEMLVQRHRVDVTRTPVVRLEPPRQILDQWHV